MALSKTIDNTFKVSVTLKGLDGLLETIGGALLLFIKPSTLDRFVRLFTQHELSRHPHDYIATHLLHTTSHLTQSTTVYASIYLLSHGLAKVVLVIAVLKQKYWAYPGMIGLLGLFVVYQVYKIAVTGSVAMIVLTIFDLFVMWLTWLEWQSHTHHNHNS